MYLTKRGHEVAGADNYYRRDWVQEMGSQSATPIRKMTERLVAFHENFSRNLQFFKGDDITILVLTHSGYNSPSCKFNRKKEQARMEGGKRAKSY